MSDAACPFFFSNRDEKDGAGLRADARSAVGSVVDGAAGALADAFYEVLLDDPEAKAFLDHSTVEQRLKAVLAGWLRNLFPANGDGAEADGEAFEARQRKIGEVHARSQVPLHLVMAGIEVLRERLTLLVRALDAPWDRRFEGLQWIGQRLNRALELMSRSYVGGVESRVRSEEAYRLFSLDQDVGTARETQRASLMDWAQATLFQLLDGGPAQHLRRLSNVPFGLWIRHRAGAMFEHSPELKAIVAAMARVDDEILPRLGAAPEGERAECIKELRVLVDEIAYLLGEMFQGLADMESGRDALTRTLNRRFLPSILKREISFANGNGSDLSVLLLDIDHFKAVNDSYGHQAGDMVLRQVAEAIAANIRPSDFLFRYGGEEFLVVLVEVDPVHGAMVAERIRTALADHPLRIGEHDRRVTMSLGLAQHDGHPDPDYLIRAADRALYRAKENGRNRVEIA